MENPYTNMMRHRQDRSNDATRQSRRWRSPNRADSISHPDEIPAAGKRLGVSVPENVQIRNHSIKNKYFPVNDVTEPKYLKNS
jgi:hypothetical protein